MRVKVKFFSTFRGLFAVAEREVELKSGARVQDLLAIICDSDECRKQLFDESGRLRRDVKMLRKGKDIQILDELSSGLENGDVILMFPSIFGG